MADGVVGTAIRTGFSTGVPSETFAVNSALYASATDFSSLVTFPEHGGNGDYDIVFTPAAAGDYRARWTGNLSGAEFTETWRVATVAQADPVAALLSGTVTLQSPVLADGAAEVVAGDDYLAAIGRALSWTFPNQAIPAGATLALKLFGPNDALVLTKPMTVAQAGPPAIATADLTRAETAALPTGTLRTAVVLTRTGGEVATLLRSELTVGTVPP